MSATDLAEYIVEIKRVLSRVRGIDYAYFFGSALNRLLPGSDIDILVGGDLGFDQKAKLAMELSLGLKRDVDIILAKEASYELIINAFSRGESIFVNKKDSLRQDYFKSYFLYDANTALRNIRLERIKRIYGT
jgi:predicted nucleotidyltransferase